MSNSQRQVGKVYLVGAGPGDAGLITLRGAECLRRADVVLYDYLVNPRILEHARAGALLECLGRHGHGRLMPQEEVNARLVAEARSGKTVVRLKGGDPAVFARGAEEAACLRDAGIPFEIVPGITAALAAGSYAGIPVTHRDLASAVTLVTGQGADSRDATAVDYRQLATIPGTLVVYMGVTTAPRWTAELIDGGMPPDTPAAIVRRCSWPDQVTIRCTLGEVAGQLQSRRMRPPVVVIVGPVVREAGDLDWFSARPLFGQKVLVTRPEHQAAGLREPLEELGAEVLLQPAIEITSPDDWGPVDRAIDALDRFDWVVFSSGNGVRGFLGRLFDRGYDLRRLGGVRLAAVGPATAGELGSYRLQNDVRPGEQFRAEALAEALRPHAAGGRFLLIRASRGREVLSRQLTAAGASVEQVVVYRSSDVAAPREDVREALAAGRIHWITVTSSAIARSLHAMFGEQLQNARLVSISPVTSDTLRELGQEPAAEASQYTMAGVVASIVQACASDEG